VRVDRLLAPAASRAQGVQAHPRDHPRQPRANVLNAVDAGAAHAQPGVLDRIVGLGERAEHPVGHRLEVWPVLFEALDQPVALVHVPTAPVARAV
jgi:hypothetical protein